MIIKLEQRKFSNHLLNLVFPTRVNASQPIFFLSAFCHQNVLMARGGMEEDLA